MKQSRQQYLAASGAALFTPTVIFIIAVNGVILPNLDEIPYNWDLIIKFLGAFTVSIMLGIPLFIGALHLRAFDWLARLSLLWGVSILLWDASSLLFKQPDETVVGMFIVESVMLLAAAFVLFRIKLSDLFRIFSVIALVSLANGVVNQYLTTAKVEGGYHVARSDPSEGTRTNREASPQRFNGNVYHIMLDAYQSEAYQYLAPKLPKLNEQPFTYFPEFSTNSAWTWSSTAELFYGDFYTPTTSVHDWYMKSYQEGVLDDLVDNGVTLHLYPYYPFYCHSAAATCSSSQYLEKDMLGEIWSNQTVIDLWFLKLVPGTVRYILNAQYAQERDASGSFRNWGYGFSVSTASKTRGTPVDSDHPYFSVQQFMQLLDNEASRPATGQYVFAHLILPHGPQVLDEACNYVGRTTPDDISPKRYLKQVECAHKLITLLIERLRSLDRLDNALIIIHSDHGFYFHPAHMGVLLKSHTLNTSIPWVQPRADDSSTWPSEYIEVRSSAVLLVKLPGASTAAISNEPVQMIDLAPTILKHFNIASSSYRGIPIQDIVIEGTSRDRLFFAANDVPRATRPEVISVYRYVNGKWRFEEDIITLPE